MRGRWTTLQQSHPVASLSVYSSTALRSRRAFSYYAYLQIKHKSTPKSGSNQICTAKSDGTKTGYMSLETMSTAMDHGLPLSPLMNPKMVAARKRYRNPKPSVQDHKSSAFSEKLKRNPYGTFHLFPFHYDLLAYLLITVFLSQPRSSQPPSVMIVSRKHGSLQHSISTSPSSDIP